MLDILSSGSSYLSLPENLPFEDWRDIGVQLARASGRLNWLIGDWWAFGLHRYGERKAVVQSEDWHGPSYERCMNIAYVCQTFRETSRRREVLSFGHHEAVAALPAAKADELLDWRLEGIDDRGRPRSIRELRATVDEYWPERRASAPPPRDPWPPAERVAHIVVKHADPQPMTLMVPSRPSSRASRSTPRRRWPGPARTGGAAAGAAIGH